MYQGSLHLQQRLLLENKHYFVKGFDCLLTHQAETLFQRRTVISATVFPEINAWLK